MMEDASPGLVDEPPQRTNFDRKPVEQCLACGFRPPETSEFCTACGTRLTGVKLAGFGRRLGGYLIDSVILFVIGLVLSILISDPLASFLFGLIIGIAYIVYLNATGGTWGKKVLGMRLLSKETGEEIGIGSAVVRYVVAYASTLALLIGYLWCLWDRDMQTWHDKAAGSIVVIE